VREEVAQLRHTSSLGKLPMNHTVLQPEKTLSPTHVGRWKVTIFNNDTNSVDEVVFVLMRATGCDQSEAEMETWEAHTFGRAPVHFAKEAECRQAAQVIASIGVKAEVAREWEDE
jgi:ATP-dependent Clp protease adapter protein ClpS